MERCNWGWGPPDCPCRFGHVCFKPFGHKGKCGEKEVNPMPCDQRQRPADWDAKGRAEANA